jgi:hypothetical protein
MPKFLDLENIKMLWDVITNDEFFSRYNKQIITDVFYNNIQGFYKSEHPKFADLTDMNKMYILLITRYVKKNCVPIPKIQISNEDVQIFGDLEMDLVEKEKEEMVRELPVIAKHSRRNEVIVPPELKKKKVVWSDDVKEKSRLDKLEKEMEIVKSDVSRLIDDIKRMNAAMLQLMQEEGIS